MLKKILIPLSLVVVIGTGLSLSPMFHEKESNTPIASAQTEKEMPITQPSGSYKTYLNIEDMQKDADLIVIATPKKPFMQREHITTYFDSPNPDEKFVENSFTVSDMKVKKVLFSKIKVKKKDLDINVLEPVGIFTDNDGIDKKRRFEGYVEMSNKEDYILYLKVNEKGNYNIVNIVDGKFEVKNTTKQIDKSSHLSEHVELHSSLEKETKTKYKKELTEYTN